ncbi:hypothetical protein HYH02_012279 [Chlamydomonas schloesseri]|uniref:1-acyl-sn-glycerol-3-phosphate acyltransferase n=1 Tax=Chlamydomonas schloesseri TaxID=2026947 RepID=A0A835T5Y2_9CHLO|nr:hypothetical protein HYH02_012279 [Chlamydomonas schloesseri]|eukprot:KAG2434449.1 hypothetical protein HYH02_012279 [Chlamydomonas schloesseri]
MASVMRRSSLAQAATERKSMLLRPKMTLLRMPGLTALPMERRPVAVAPSSAMPELPARSSLVCHAAAASVPLPGSDSAPQPNVLFAKIRAIMFFAWSFLLSLPLFVTMMVMAPLVLAFDKYRRLAQHFVNNLWACASTAPFYKVTIIGRENLPPPDKPVVYVANHQSFLDIYSLFHLQRPFKFISKTSNFLIPIIGWSMFLTGHVMINRVDRRSQLKCLQQCRDLLAEGAPVLFFPEGTRSLDCKMAGFKKGAFSVAAKAGVEVVPITLLGTGALMPSGKESQLRPGQVTIVVHKPLPASKDADKLCDAARVAVASSLPPELVGSATEMAPDEQ